MTTHADRAPTAQRSLIAEIEERLKHSPLTDEGRSLVREALGATQDPGQAVARGIYLTSITVEGFRGISEKATLHIPFGPGLTVIQGRNGSGKSSFAEGIEVALTGHNRRWEGENGNNVQTALRDGWRNLHHKGPRGLSLELRAPGRPRPLTISRSWSGPDFEQATTEVFGLEPKPQPVTALGWQEDLRAFRPILSYSELGQMLAAKPSQMYDRLAPLLGLGALTDANAWLAARNHELELPEQQAKKSLPALLEALDDTKDDRALRAAETLRSSKPDRERIRSLIAGAIEANATELSRLRRLATLVGPDTDDVASAVAALHQAARRANSARAGDAGDALLQADVLDGALRLRSRHPTDHSCPVCWTPDSIDESWAAAAASQVALLRERAAEAAAAARHLREAMSQLRGLIHNTPADLPEPLRIAWDAWVACRDVEDPTALATGAKRHAALLADACREAQEDARQRLAEHDEQWRGVVAKLAAWLELADAAAKAKPMVGQVKSAKAWLMSLLKESREARMNAISEKAQEIWRYLCEDSSVALGGVTLSGSDAYTGRKLVLDATVDGVEASALGVASQGELFSLALALFLPRVMAKQSPFDFIVIDDPVQSMDPAKVEGLARLLDDVAKTHQVVVFTHDTRLSDALRFHRIKATIRQVTRSRNSRVKITDADDPVKQELKAARDIADDRALTPALRGELVPCQCRIALEAALRQPALRTLIATCTDRDDRAVIDERIARAGDLINLASLALFGTRREKPDVYGEIKHRCGEDTARVIELCNKGAHTTVFDADEAKRFIARVGSAAQKLRDL